jgi:hypothetical protein
MDERAGFFVSLHDATCAPCAFLLELAIEIAWNIVVRIRPMKLTLALCIF